MASATPTPMDDLRTYLTQYAALLAEHAAETGAAVTDISPHVSLVSSSDSLLHMMAGQWHACMGRVVTGTQTLGERLVKVSNKVQRAEKRAAEGAPDAPDKAASIDAAVKALMADCAEQTDLIPAVGGLEALDLRPLLAAEGFTPEHARQHVRRWRVLHIVFENIQTAPPSDQGGGDVMDMLQDPEVLKLVESSMPGNMAGLNIKAMLQSMSSDPALKAMLQSVMSGKVDFTKHLMAAAVGGADAPPSQ